MATGPATGGDPTDSGRVPSVRTVVRAVLSALVSAPGRSAATLLVAGPYLWLGYYVVGTATGRLGDVIVGGDWLTLVFTTYALFSALALALAHRVLRVGLTELTVEYLLDVIVLCWLAVFYFVWMLARDPVDASTTVSELYAPVLAGEPVAILWIGVATITALVAAGIVLFPREDSRPFNNEFRTAMVTLPVVVTALVLLVRPGADSVLWPFVGGVFVGTLVGGIGRIHVIASAVARGLFAVLSLLVWLVGAIGWVLAYHCPPPDSHVVLEHVGGDGEKRDISRDRADD
jgi:hypothetical protein